MRVEGKEQEKKMEKESKMNGDGGDGGDGGDDEGGDGMSENVEMRVDGKIEKKNDVRVENDALGSMMIDSFD